MLLIAILVSKLTLWLFIISNKYLISANEAIRKDNKNN